MNRKIEVWAFIAATLCGMHTGCAQAPRLSDSDLSQTSQSVAVTPFRAPYDPMMTEVGLTVDVVDVGVPSAALLGDLGKTVRTQLVGALSSSPNLLVADREVMAAIASEQRLNQAGATERGNGPRMGKLAAPRYLVKVVVTEFKEAVHGQSHGGEVHTGPLFTILSSTIGGNAARVLSGVGAADPNFSHGSETIEGVVGLEVRLVDIERGVVVGQTRALGKLTRKNSRTVLGVAGINTSEARFSESVLGQATRAAVEDAVVQLHTLLRGREAVATAPLRSIP